MKRTVAILLAAILCLLAIPSFAAGDLDWTGIKVPDTLNQGEKFTLSGKVFSVFGKVTQIRYRIMDASWHPVLNIAQELNTHELYIQDSASGKIEFEKLPAGNYTLIITATAVVYGSECTRTVAQHDFKVKGVSSAKNETKKETGYQNAYLTYDGLNWPSTLTRGQSFELRGVINAVHCELYFIAGNIIASNGDSVMCSEEMVETRKYDIQYGFNKKLQFEKLPAGDYTYMVYAAYNADPGYIGEDGPDSSIVYILEKPFTVVNSSGSSSGGSFTIWITGGANVRSQPSQYSDWLGEYAKGTKLTAYARVPSLVGGNDWYQINYQGRTAYVSTGYASTSKPNTKPTENTSGKTPSTMVPSTKTPVTTQPPTKAPNNETTQWVWTNWSTERKTITNPSAMKEESRVRYGWWAAKCKNCGQHNPYWGSETKCKGCGRYLPRNNVTSVYAYTSDTSGTQKILGRNGGRYIDSLPYWRESSDNDKVEYRYAVKQSVQTTKVHTTDTK